MTENERKDLARKVNSALKKAYPNASISLRFSNALELLVATALSAQCTDERVNEVTKTLFKKYKKAEDYAGAPIEQLEQDIRSTGFYRNKAKSIKSFCADIIEKHGGRVPSTMEELTKLSGVGRKTANVILGNVYGVPGIVVDTHVSRVSRRLGLTEEKNPEKIERDLMKLIPEKDWTRFSHRMILFGRETCRAKKPECGSCRLFSLCKWEEKGKFAGK